MDISIQKLTEYVVVVVVFVLDSDGREYTKSKWLKSHPSNLKSRTPPFIIIIIYRRYNRKSRRKNSNTYQYRYTRTPRRMNSIKTQPSHTINY